MIKRTFVLLLAFTVVCVIAFFAGRSTRQDKLTAYIERRLFVLTNSAERTAPGSVYIVGDSLVERSGIQVLCGHPVFNGGVSTATLHQIAEQSVKAAKAARPFETVVAIGTNDVMQGTDVKEWQAELENTVWRLPNVTAIVEIPRVNVGAPFTNLQTEPFNAAIREVAHRRRIKTVPQMSFETVDDGVHQSPKGAAQWRSNMDAACIPGKDTTGV